MRAHETREDEPLDDRRYLQLNGRQQAELIEQYCGGIETRIRSAGSYDDAKRIVDQACGAFERECPSDLIRRSLAERVKEMAREYWEEVK